MDALDEDFIDAVRSPTPPQYVVSQRLIYILLHIIQFKVNTLGVIHAITAFLPLLRASAAPIKKIVVLATPAGDLKWTRVIGIADETAAYATTKASGAVATTKYALKLKDEGFAVVLLLPGAVDIAGTQGLEGSQGGFLFAWTAAHPLRMVVTLRCRWQGHCSYRDAKSSGSSRSGGSYRRVAVPGEVCRGPAQDHRRPHTGAKWPFARTHGRGVGCVGSLCRVRNCLRLFVL